MKHKVSSVTKLYSIYGLQDQIYDANKNPDFSIYLYHQQQEHLKSKHDILDDLEYEELMSKLNAKQREALLSYLKIHPNNYSCRNLAVLWGCSHTNIINIAKKAIDHLRKYYSYY